MLRKFDAIQTLVELYHTYQYYNPEQNINR